MTEPELSFSDSQFIVSEREASSFRRPARSWGEVVRERSGAGMQRGRGGGEREGGMRVCTWNPPKCILCSLLEALLLAVPFSWHAPSAVCTGAGLLAGGLREDVADILSQVAIILAVFYSHLSKHL